MPRWERNLVIVALGVHVVDVVLDILVVLLFLVHAQWGFFFGSGCVILWAWLVSSLYVSFGGGQGPSGDDEDGISPGSRIPQFLLNFVQVQIFAEAYRCIRHHGDSDYFHTLRLMEAILESAPNSLVQLYALVMWAHTDDVSDEATTLLRCSVLASFVSVGLGLAMWEQKVQFRTSATYVVVVAMMRSFEIASRSLTLALFAGLTHPYGFWWALVVDYGVMLVLIARHKSVQITYGFFVAIPLTLVSLEPLVWRREDHAVPKDSYYMVRVIEFVVLWVKIISSQEVVATEGYNESVWIGSEVLALLSTLGLYVTLPFVWRIARQHELSRDIADWDEDGREEAEQLRGEEGHYSDSGGSGSDGDGDAGMLAE